MVGYSNLMTNTSPSPALPYFESMMDGVLFFGGSGAQVVAQEPAPGGCINNGFSVTLKDGRQCFVKMNRRLSLDMFRQDASALRILGQANAAVSSGLRVPAPLCHGVDGDHAFLMIEYLPPAVASNRYWQALGRGLAMMHQGVTKNLFGFDDDNYIGSSKQRNSWAASWPGFFAQYRLKPQLDQAKRQGLASDELCKAVESIIKRIETLVPRIATASLVHGDLWSGNVLPVASRVGVGAESPAIIDPATYYGDSRVDLAMTELFGGFPDEFYAAYREIRDVGNEYNHLKDLYNLYHLLNHLNIMGREYAADALVIARAYA